MQAVILAAGMASRLRPLTNHCPKCLLEINGKTLLDRTIEAVTQAGINEITIVTGYLGEMIEKHLTQHYPRLTFHFIHNDIYDSTNNIYSLWLTKCQVEGKDFLLMDSDIYCDYQLVKTIAGQKEDALALNRHHLGEEEIKVIPDEQMYVKEISKTCSIGDAIGESVGVERMTADYSKALFKELKIMCEDEGLTNVFYEKAFERLIPQGYSFKIIDTTSFFSMELDTVEDFMEAQQKFQ